ncbi:hypothetical protein GQ53DRAFT_842852 [Thozetella sp. PMI_491]|nr:hypothetical protein GQ53DRAFT_842852 [Thozetella sp. PMI_491]
MASLALCRSALRRGALPASFAVSAGLIMVGSQKPFRLDAVTASPRRRELSTGPRRGGLDPEVIKQLSSGSVSGFLVGLLVSVFSKTLVLLAGIGIIAIQVASRYGIDLADQLKLKKRLESSRILSALKHKPVFKLAFGATLFLSAFMSF